jgi:hypothetical protein
VGGRHRLGQLRQEGERAVKYTRLCLPTGPAGGEKNSLREEAVIKKADE